VPSPVEAHGRVKQASKAGYLGQFAMAKCDVLGDMLLDHLVECT
jgi:hypothetical protein